jgi:hypothetical protein
MKKVNKGKRNVFANRLGDEFLMAPIYLMYLSIALLLMFIADRYVPGIAFRVLDFGVVAGLFGLFFLIRAYVSLGSNYHDFIVGEEQISIVNRIPGFRRKVTVPIGEIEEVLFTESHIDLEKPRFSGLIREAYRHPERKWVEIRTNTDRLRYKCYGISHAATGTETGRSYDQLYGYLKTELQLTVRRVGGKAA